MCPTEWLLWPGNLMRYCKVPYLLKVYLSEMKLSAKIKMRKSNYIQSEVHLLVWAEFDVDL